MPCFFFKKKGEIQRLSSRVVELEALTNVLKTQLDQAGTSEQHAVREVQRELDRAEMEIERLRERLQDMESKEESLGTVYSCAVSYDTP